MATTATKACPAEGHAVRLQQGHAFEARVYAESPERGFMPGTGTLARWALPDRAVCFRHNGDVRVDSGVRAGDQVSHSSQRRMSHASPARPSARRGPMTEEARTALCAPCTPLSCHHRVPECLSVR